MCGPNSALGLAEAERWQWPYLRERLRRPHMSMGLMRAVLGGDSEVAVVIATSPAGISTPLAVLITPAIAAELTMSGSPQPQSVGHAKVGPYDVEVVYDEQAAPAALLISPWLFENLSLYARKLWVRH